MKYIELTVDTEGHQNIFMVHRIEFFGMNKNCNGNSDKGYTFSPKIFKGFVCMSGRFQYVLEDKQRILEKILTAKEF